MQTNKFVADVKKAFSSVHKDIQNMKNLFDKLNKKVDIIGEQVDMMKTAIVKISEEESTEDVPPVPPGSEEEESTGDESVELYKSE